MQSIVLTDFHLDKLNKLFDNGVELQIEELRKCLLQAREKGIRHCIIAGDISNKPELSTDASNLLQILFHEFSDITFDIIKGNHDVEHKHAHSLLPFERLVKTGILTNVHIYTKPTVVKRKLGSLKIKFFMCPFPYEEEPKEKMLCVGHQEVAGAKRDNGSLVKGESISRKCKWVMGHYHLPQDVGNIHFVGTQYQTSFGESLPKYYSIINWKTKDIERVEVFPAFKLIQLRVNSKEDFIINPNPLYLYKVWVQDDIQISIANYPNIIEFHPYSNKQKLKDFESIDDIKIDPAFGLANYLEVRGLSKKQINKGVKIVEEML